MPLHPMTCASGLKSGIFSDFPRHLCSSASSQVPKAAQRSKQLASAMGFEPAAAATKAVAPIGFPSYLPSASQKRKDHSLELSIELPESSVKRSKCSAVDAATSVAERLTKLNEAMTAHTTSHTDSAQVKPCGKPSKPLRKAATPSEGPSKAGHSELPRTAGKADPAGCAPFTASCTGPVQEHCKQTHALIMNACDHAVKEPCRFRQLFPFSWPTRGGVRLGGGSVHELYLERLLENSLYPVSVAPLCAVVAPVARRAAQKQWK